MKEPHSVRKNFSKADKKKRTILLCEMLEYHNIFLEAAFQSDGYSFEVLNNPVKDKTQALRYISNDYCYPAVLIIAQFLEYLATGERKPCEVAFMEPQAGGACRAGNIYNLLQRVLYKKYEQGCTDYRDIPVISLNFQGEEKHSGFQITPRLLFAAMAAVCYGDLIMCLYQQVKPYEAVEGETDRVRARVEEQLCDCIRRHKNGKKYRIRNYRYAVEQFAAIPVQSKNRKRIGIAGEIYMKYSRLGNDNVEQFILDNGGAPYSGGFINYCIYLMDTERYKAEHYDFNGAGAKIYRAVVNFLEKIQRQMYDVVAENGRFDTDDSFEELKKKCAGIIQYGCNTADGWLIAAEVVQYIEKGCKSVLILHPFGCLVSHVCERGILHKLHEKYPTVSIQTVEYDYDQSKTLRESRILMALQSAAPHWNEGGEE